jgi:hypothetical protein
LACEFEGVVEKLLVGGVSGHLWRIYHGRPVGSGAANLDSHLFPIVILSEAKHLCNRTEIT